MNKIPIIIQREYCSRVRKKSFILMTLFIPLLLAAAISIPLWLSGMEEPAMKKVAVIDQTGKYAPLFCPDETYFFDLINEPLQSFHDGRDYDALVIISDDLCDNPGGITICSKKQDSLEIKRRVAGLLNPFIENEKLEQYRIPQLREALEELKTGVRIKTIPWIDDGQETDASYETALTTGMAATFLIYFFILIYGSQVMRGVAEEKTSRIVEIIISSVKPFELMMGKIVGIALAGLTQFLIWAVFIAIFFIVSTKTWETGFSQNAGILAILANPSMLSLAVFFIIYFLGGYLLYASLFAAIGAASDSDTDTQQFMIPLTIPVIFALFAAIYSAGNPGGTLAFWCSLIPLTSPIVMMVRIPFGVPVWELALSLSILLASFTGSTLIAAKIYRTGILMYGKKINYREIWKWIF